MKYLRSNAATVFQITFALHCISPSFLALNHLKMNSLLGEAHLESYCKWTCFNKIQLQESLLRVKPIYSMFSPDMCSVTFYPFAHVIPSTEMLPFYASFFFFPFSFLPVFFLYFFHPPTSKYLSDTV